MDYIPSTDSGFADWLLNFSTLLTAAPTTYGLTSGNATTVAGQNTAYQAAYLLATNPATRTPATVASKDAVKTTALGIVRPFGVNIARNSGVTDGNKTAIGVTVAKTVPTPVPPPTTQPTLSLVSAVHNQCTLAFRDTSTPTSKAKPPGAIGVEVRRILAAPVGTTPDEAPYWGTVTKSPFVVDTTGNTVGAIATYWTRFVTRSGPGGISQVGPWSSALNVPVI